MAVTATGQGGAGRFYRSKLLAPFHYKSKRVWLQAGIRNEGAEPMLTFVMSTEDVLQSRL
jgi:hypothetical protein